MSVIHCDECNKLVDTDYVGCEDNPNGNGELICGDCYDKINPDKGTTNPNIETYPLGALGDGT